MDIISSLKKTFSWGKHKTSKRQNFAPFPIHRIPQLPCGSLPPCDIVQSLKAKLITRPLDAPAYVLPVCHPVGTSNQAGGMVREPLTN